MNFRMYNLLLRRIQGGYPRLEKVSYGDSLHGEIGCESICECLSSEHIYRPCELTAT
jgi:hypothetical protein